MRKKKVFFVRWGRQPFSILGCVCDTFTSPFRELVRLSMDIDFNEISDAGPSLLGAFCFISHQLSHRTIDHCFLAAIWLPMSSGHMMLLQLILSLPSLAFWATN